MKRNRSPQQAFAVLKPQDGRNTLVLTGEWTVFNAPAIRRAIKAEAGKEPVDIDATNIERLDTAGAIILKKLIKDGTGQARLTDRQRDLLNFMPDLAKQSPASPKPGSVRAFFITLGKRSLDICDFTYSLIVFIGQVSARFAANIARPRHFRLPSIVRHINETGINALPIVSLLSFLMSMVIAYQASIQLRKFGASIFTIDLTVISLLREMGVLITAIMVAGRSGSAFAAEIGVMKLREEVDALKTIGMDPIEILVLPRLIGLLIALPILTFAADVVGLAGGAMMSVTMLGIPLDQFIDRAQRVGTTTMFLVGIIKAPVFAFLIAIVGTYQGMNVSGSAESVGRLTTVAVVQSIFLVILADAVFSIIFAKVGL